MSTIAETVFHELIDYLEAGIKSPVEHGADYIYRISISLEKKIEMLKLLPIGEEDFSLFWRGRDQRQSRLALSVSYVIEGTDYKDTFNLAGRVLASADYGVRVYGGIAFYSVAESAEAGEEWLKFSRNKMVIPFLEILEEEGQQQVALNLRVRANEAFQDAMVTAIARLKKFAYRGQQEFEVPPIDHLSSNPDHQGWRDQVNQAMKDFESGRVAKLVLSRRVDATFKKNLSAIWVLRQLMKSKEPAFVFFVQLKGSGAFLGRTPELLYSRDGLNVSTEAIAGTQALDKTDELLIESDKDQEEHAFVVKSLRQTLSEVCESFEANEVNDLLKLDHIQHLYRAFRGRLKASVTDTDLISAFHPSPALGGYPRLEAKARLKEIENFDRGWFGAPLGWLEKDASEFVVAIRSARIRDNLISLFSGAGIIAASDADKEWQELNAKLKTFSSFLNIDVSQLS